MAAWEAVLRKVMETDPPVADDPAIPLSECQSVQLTFVKGLIFQHADNVWRVIGWDHRVEGSGRDAKVVSREPVVGYVMTEPDFERTVAEFFGRIYRHGEAH